MIDSYIIVNKLVKFISLRCYLISIFFDAKCTIVELFTLNISANTNHESNEISNYFIFSSFHNEYQ